MGFTVRDLQDLLRLLEAHPQWQAELRRALLADDFLALPSLVRGLAETQQRAEERLSRLETAVAALAEAQRRSEEHLARLDITVAALLESQRRIEEEVAVLRRQTDELRGDAVERRYRERAGAYFGALVRRAYALTDRELADLLGDAEDRELLLPDEVDEVRRADAIVRGRRRDTGSQVYLVIEASAGIGRTDVNRAYNRAQLLAKLHPALPVVAGKQIVPGAQDLAQRMGVAVLLDGQVESAPPTALAGPHACTATCGAARRTTPRAPSGMRRAARDGALTVPAPAPPPPRPASRSRRPNQVTDN
jgi:hypothetical protein